jgi:hypothetical protein
MFHSFRVEQLVVPRWKCEHISSDYPPCGSSAIEFLGSVVGAKIV